MLSHRIPALFALTVFTAALLRAQQAPVPASSLTQPAATLPSESDESAPDASVDETPLDRPVSKPAISQNSQIRAALDVLTNVLEQYRKSGNRSGEAGTLCAIANSYNALGQQQKAIENFQEALAIIRVSGTKQDEARTLSHMGDVYRGWGFPQEGVRFYRQALAAYSSTNDAEGRAVALNNIGVAFLALRDKKKSLEYLTQALASYRTLDDRHAEGLTLNNLGMVYTATANDPQKALDYFQQAMTKLQLAEEDRDAEATVLDNIGAVCVKLGHKDLAETSFGHALSLFRRVPDAEGEARVLKHLRSLGQSGTLASTHSVVSAQ